MDGALFLQPEGGLRLTHAHARSKERLETEPAATDSARFSTPLQELPKNSPKYGKFFFKNSESRSHSSPNHAPSRSKYFL
jgi:hypothetical protein